MILTFQWTVNTDNILKEYEKISESPDDFLVDNCYDLVIKENFLLMTVLDTLQEITS